MELDPIEALSCDIGGAVRTASEEIAALVYAYAAAIDAGDLPGLADLFTRATLRSDGRPDVRRGRDEVLALYESMVRLYDGRPGTKHVTTNLVVEVCPDGTSAAASSYYTVFQALPGLALQAIVAGRYDDRFARDESGWHFTDRLIFVDLVGDLSQHLKRWPPGS
jgi:hypothetical protein